jgi:hypothetical protein
MHMRAAWLVCAVSCLAASAQAQVSVHPDGDKIVLTTPLLFGSGSAVIRDVDQQTVLGLARLLSEHDEFALVGIDGRTDDQGSDELNERLALARANAVVSGLVGAGVSRTRLQARAMPVDVNASRSDSRRVDVTVLKVAPAGTLAEVAAVANDVALRAPTSSWENAAVGETLSRAWRLKTGDDSASTLQFIDQSQAQLRENSLIVVYGAGRLQRSGEVELSSGGLRMRMDELLGAAPMQVTTTAGHIDMSAGNMLLSVDSTGMNRVANHGGKPVRVRPKKPSSPPPTSTTASAPTSSVDAVEVTVGMGTRMEVGKAPEPPKPLPASPSWASPPTLTWNKDGPTVQATLRVQPGHTHRVEVLQTQLGQVRNPTPQSVMRLMLPANVDVIDVRSLPLGHYELVTSSVDATGMESIPTNHAIVVAAPQQPTPASLRQLQPTPAVEQDDDAWWLPAAIIGGVTLATAGVIAVGTVVVAQGAP